MIPSKLFPPAFLLLSFVAAARAQDLPAPAEHLGHPLGADGVLPRWERTASWFHLLGERSPRAIVERVGTTTEGREFLLATISSERNLARLGAVKAANALLADPRGASEEALDAALAEPVVLFVSSAMHATECAGPQFSMEFAHLLATSDDEPWKSARERVVVLLAPNLNPDGQDHVADWYNAHVGTPYEASGLLELYQHYAGHDNNRDWFMLTQSETRIVTELLYSVWRPQVYWDVHQQGSTRERFFVPPFRDPLNPNLDPGIVTGIDLLGTRALFDLTREGLSGVSTGVTYDMWWNGGNRNVPVRHNIVGLLTEAASANLATPIFLPRSELSPPRGLGSYAPSNLFPNPWPGGWWRLRDILDYELAFARSLLSSLAREPRTWRQNALDAARRALDLADDQAPRAWILPADARDRGALARLVDVLLRSGVELHASEDGLTLDGRTWPAGSLVIHRDQPYGAHVKDLFDVQRYPAGDPPYDVAGWTLPFLLGVHRVETMQSPDPGGLRRVTSVEDALRDVAPDPRLARREGALSTRDSDGWKRLFRHLADGGSLHWLVGDDAGLVLPLEQASDPPRGLPRIGLYAPWQGDMNEGWTRWVFDTFGVPYVRVRNEMLRAGELGRFLDVLVLPGTAPRALEDGRAAGSVPGPYTGGLDPEGSIAIEEFVRAGGRAVAFEDSATYLIDLFELPLVDVTRGKDAGTFACPGSVLRALPVPGNAECADLPPSLAVFFARSRAWRAMTDGERKEARRVDTEDPRVLLRYASTRLLLSGWIDSPATIEGAAAWLHADHGQGSVHLFAFRPQYRGWSQSTFHLLFRALLHP